MNRFPLKKHYPCIFKSCSNKVSYYNDSIDNCVLLCKLHRAVPMKIWPNDCDLDKMYTKLPRIPSESVEEFASLTFSMQSVEIRKTISDLSDSDLSDLPIQQLTTIFNYMFKEFRLYHFYGKLANFQAPCIKKIILEVMNFDFPLKDAKLFFQIIKEIFRKVFVHSNYNGFYEILHQIVNVHLVLRDKCSSRQKFKTLKYFVGKKFFSWGMKSTDKLILFTQLNSINRMSIIEHLINPRIKEFLTQEDKEIWKAREETLFRLSNFRFAYLPFRQDTQFYREIALSLHRLGYFKRAVACFKTALKLIKEKTEEVRIQIAIELAIVHFDLGLYQIALFYFRHASDHLKERFYTQEFAKCLYYIAYCFARLWEFEEAFIIMQNSKRKGLKVNFNEVLGYIFFIHGQYKTAQGYLEEVKQMNNLASHYMKGITHRLIPHFQFQFRRNLILTVLCFFHLGYEVKAIYYLEYNYRRISKTIGKNHPYFAEIAYCLGYVLIKQNKLREALSYLQEATSCCTLNFTMNNFLYMEVLYLKASIYFDLKNAEMAEFLFDIILKIAGKFRKCFENFYIVHLARGRICLLQKYKEEAYEHFCEARSIIVNKLGVNSHIYVHCQEMILLAKTDDNYIVHHIYDSLIKMILKQNPEYFHPEAFRILLKKAETYSRTVSRNKTLCFINKIKKLIENDPMKQIALRELEERVQNN